jgi:Abnormal spindle-like microcephaly-assoc'd, ASPM-SPD-2-Hydin/Beta-propeller repeat
MTSRPLQIAGIILSALILGGAVLFLGPKGPGIRSLAAAGRGPALKRQTIVSPAAMTSNESAHWNRVYARLPLSFEANQGQAGGRVKFLSRGPGYTLFLTGDEALLALKKGSRKSKVESRNNSRQSTVDSRKSTTLKAGAPEITNRQSAIRNASLLAIRLVGANPGAAVEGKDELPGKSNYLIGRDPAKWRTGVPNYARVRYTGVYPGVDLVYYGNQGQLEYDFVVAPGADPRLIRLEVGAVGGPPGTHRDAPLRIGRNGDLVVKIDGRQVRFHKPVAYQTDARGGKEYVEARYVLGREPLQAANQRSFVAFEPGSYDRHRPLVIDPALSYSTYLGGSQEDEASSIAVDSSGNAYVAGFTVSADFPITAGSFDTTCGTDGTCNGSLDDLFVTKLNPAGTALVYSTFVGGSNSDFGYGLAIDSAGDAYVTGTTFSADFPTTPGAFQSACATNCSDGDGFVLELNPTGSNLIYSTYLGGSAYDQGNAINVDTAGNAYVFGYTGSRNFPVSAGAFQRSIGGVQDAFVTKLNATGSALVYSTYLGGNGADLGFGLFVNAAGDAYVVGQTNSSNFPTTSGAFQTTLGGLTGGFVTKLNATGSALIFSTYLNGTSTSTNPCAACATDVFLDSSGNVYVSGLTYETDFPVTSGAFQTTFAGGFHDAFATKLNRTGTALVYSTYLGGSSDDGAVALAVDAAGNAYIHGNTYSTNFPTTPNAFQPASGGPPDAFVAELDPTGSALLYSTYLGGSGNEFAKANRNLALDHGTNPDVFVTGFTSSTNFPTTPGAFQTALASAGSDDAFVTKFAPFSTTIVFSPTSLTFPTQLVGTSSRAQGVTLTNNGTSAVSITSISIAGANSSDFSETNTCGASIAAGASCTITVTFKPTSSGTRAATVSVADNAAGSPQTLSLTGTGTFVKLAPSSLNFGSVPVGQTSSAKAVTLTNGGTTALSITAIKFTGKNTGDFTETNTCGSSVAAHASCTISVTFKPAAKGSRSASLGVSDNGGGSPQLVAVSGTGT